MPGLRLSYWNPRLLRTVFHQLQQQQQTGLFCDVTLQGDGEDSIHVHSCVIAACSPYLANLLMGRSEISKISDPRTPFYRSVLRIHGIKSLHLFPLVHYMYTSELEVAPRDVSDVLKAAQKLQIPELELLKLEGGRLVRSEPGRRLNRNCLGSKIHAHYAKGDKPANAIIQGIMNSGTNIEINSSINRQNKIGNDVISVRLLDVKQSSENVLDIGTSSCGMPEIRIGNLGFLDVLSSGRSTKDFANSDGFLENMPYAPSNQNSQEDSTPCSQIIKDCKNSQDFEKDILNSQDFVQDVITNHKSQTDVTRSLDLMECKLKGSFENAPSQDLSEQKKNIYGLLDNVQFSQDPLHNEQSIGGLAEDVQSLMELPEDVQIKGQLPDNMNDVCECPVAVQSIEELPKVAQSICDLPENVQSSEGLPETGARGEDTQLNLLHRCKQNKSNPEVMPDKERECSVKPIQSRYRTKSRKGLLKRIRLNRKREEIASIDTKLLKCKNFEMNCNNIDISVSDTFGIVDNEGLTSNPHYESDKSGTVDRKSLTLSSHCGPETNATVDHEDLKSSTYYELKQNVTALQEDLPSITHCESETSGTVDHEDSPSSTHCEPETSVVYNKSKDESRKRQYSLENSFENNLEKVKLRKANDGLSWEVVKGVESINIAHPFKEKEHFKKLEEQVQEILSVTTPITPDLDVGVYSPPMFLEKCVWPDLSSESDIEIDILG